MERAFSDSLIVWDGGSSIRLLSSGVSIRRLEFGVETWLCALRVDSRFSIFRLWLLHSKLDGEETSSGNANDTEDENIVFFDVGVSFLDDDILFFLPVKIRSEIHNHLYHTQVVTAHFRWSLFSVIGEKLYDFLTESSTVVRSGETA